MKKAELEEVKTLVQDAIKQLQGYMEVYKESSNADVVKSYMECEAEAATFEVVLSALNGNLACLKIRAGKD